MLILFQEESIYLPSTVGKYGDVDTSDDLSDKFYKEIPIGNSLCIGMGYWLALSNYCILVVGLPVLDIPAMQTKILPLNLPSLVFFWFFLLCNGLVDNYLKLKGEIVSRIFKNELHIMQCFSTFFSQMHPRGGLF